MCVWGGGGGPPSHFQLIWTSFSTSGTIIDEFKVKGAHPLSCRNFFEDSLKMAGVIAFFVNEKNFSKLKEKINKKIKLKMAKAQSIFKILRSIFCFFANTPIFMVE